MSAHLPATRVGHRLEVALQIGRSAGIILVDDLEVWAPRDADGNPPRVMPPPLQDARLVEASAPAERPS